VNDSGDVVAFRTAASNVIAGDTNRATDVVRTDMLTGKLSLVSRTNDGRFANTDSSAPAIGRTGLDIAFQTSASNINPIDRNCTGDVYELAVPHSAQQLISLDSLDRVPNSPSASSQPCPNVVAAPQVNPRVSNYLNYAVWEASYPLLDIPLAQRWFPGVSPDDAARASVANPALHQVYMRYIGPR
jgi:hypothetical protein